MDEQKSQRGSKRERCQQMLKRIVATTFMCIAASGTLAQQQVMVELKLVKVTEGSSGQVRCVYADAQGYTYFLDYDRGHLCANRTTVWNDTE